MNRLFLTAVLAISVQAQIPKTVFPQGSIKALDRTLNRELPIVGAVIEITSEGKRYETVTDSLGRFAFPSLKGQWASYRLKWQSRNNAFSIHSSSFGQAYLEGPRGASQWHTVIKEGDQHFYSVIFRACAAYLAGNWVTEADRFTNVKIKAYPHLKPFGKGSARHNALFETIQIWGLSKRGKQLSDIRLFSYAAHELAHAHHDQFYQGVSQHLGTDLRIKESWAEALRYFLTRSEYNDSYEEVKTYSKQKPFYGGWHSNDWGKKKKYFYNYTPLMIDLIDTVRQEAVDDRVSGYTLAQIKSVMSERSCRDFPSFKELLRARFDNPTEQYLDLLFSEMEEKR